MDFDIQTTYNYLDTIDNYTFTHYCTKNKCITCPFSEACNFLTIFLEFLEKTINKEKLL